MTSPSTAGGDLGNGDLLPRRLLTRKRSSHRTWRSSMHSDGGEGPLLTRPLSERLTLRLTVCGDLRKRRSAQRWGGPYSYGGVLLSGLVCKFVRCGHVARASCSSSSKRCSSRSRSDRVKCQSNGTAVCS